ncbi:MAG: response regulator [Defluviitaleaceae bacterium]|nr:response regulator [Defluviitaleaceae bacterium]
MKAMIVEDTAILRKIMRDILKEFCGLEDGNIHEAADATKAINDYKHTRPDIVFLDISMPGMNGKEAIKHFLAIDADAKIVMFTGSRNETDVKECISAGAKDYLVKPLSPQRVQESVRKVVSSDKLPDILK